MALNKQQKLHRTIKEGLVDQLKRNGTSGEYFTDLVEDYMCFWRTKYELLSDIDERGAKVDRLDSKGQVQIVNNESIDQLLKINVQMIAILRNLGIKPVEGESTPDDEGDDL